MVTYAMEWDLEGAPFPVRHIAQDAPNKATAIIRGKDVIWDLFSIWQDPDHVAYLPTMEEVIPWVEALFPRTGVDAIRRNPDYIVTGEHINSVRLIWNLSGTNKLEVTWFSDGRVVAWDKRRGYWEL